MYRPVVETWRVKGRFRYRCQACGTEFDQSFERDTEVVADPTPTAAEVAEKIAGESIRYRRPRPCPSCGSYLPKAGADKQQWWDQWLAVFVPITLLVLAGFGYGTRRVHLYWSYAEALPALTLGALIGYVWVGRVFRVGLPDTPVEPALRRPTRRPTYILVAVAFGLFLIPPAMRLTLQTPLNDHCSPLVVPPGKEVRIGVDDTRVSVKGDWGGVARVRVVNAEELKLSEPLAVSTREMKPVDEMRVKSDEKAERVDLYADVIFPDRPDLNGVALHLQVELDIEYPAAVGPGRFRYESARVSAERFVTFSSSTTATRDRWVHITVWLVATTLMTLASVSLFVNHLRTRRWEKPPGVILDSPSESSPTV